MLLCNPWLIFRVGYVSSARLPSVALLSSNYINTCLPHVALQFLHTHGTLVYSSHLPTAHDAMHVTRDTTVLLLRWRYSPGWALASFTIPLQASRSLALSHHSFIPIFLRSVHTSSNRLTFGLPLRLVAYNFPYIFF